MTDESQIRKAAATPDINPLTAEWLNRVADDLEAGRRVGPEELSQMRLIVRILTEDGS